MTGTNDKKIAELQKIFEGKWSAKQWGDIHTFLGMRAKYNRGEGGLTLEVEQKIKGMLKRFPGHLVSSAIQDSPTATVAGEQGVESGRH